MGVKLYCIVSATRDELKQQKLVFLLELDPITVLLVVVKRIKLGFVTSLWE